MPKDNDNSQHTDLPKGWEWLKNLDIMAKLPHLGLPSNWNETEKKHAQIAYDPVKKQAYDLSEDKITINKPVDFIKSTKDKHPMPGAKAPATARVELFHDPRLQKV